MHLLAELPPPPAFDRWVLEQPLPLAAVCFFVAVAVVIALRRRGELKRGLIGGAILAFTGAGVLAAGMLVETPRERLSFLTAEFIRRVFAADAEWAEKTLSDPLMIASAGQVFDSMGKEQLLATIRNFEAFGTREWTQKSWGSAIDGEYSGRTQATIRVSARYLGNQTLPSTWEFTWRLGRDGEWVITRIECLTMFGQPPRMNWERDARNIANTKPGDGKGGLRPDAF